MPSNYWYPNKMINPSRLASVIFDSGRNLFESEYEGIVESIKNDLFSLDGIVLEYKNPGRTESHYTFSLDSGDKVMISESAISDLSSLDIDKAKLTEFMRKSKSNFIQILEALDGNA